MPMTDHADPEYFMGRDEAERGRLRRQSQLYGPLTRQLFVDAGIGRGMRVLDVGSGVGDVASLVAELVGPAGSVVGVDTDGEALRVARARAAASGWQNTRFVEGDIRDVTLEGQFDAVVGRFVLFWVGDVRPVLQACIRHLRPGGIVAFQEHDSTANYRAVPPSRLLEPWHRAVEAYARDSRASAAEAGRPGVDLDVGYHLYGAFLEAGLAAPQMRYDAPVGGGPGWVGYRAFADHMRSLVPMLVQLGGVTEEEIAIDSLAERLRDDVVAQRGVFRCMPAIGVWARWPGQENH